MYKKLVFLAFTIFFISNSYSQLNVSYHQSNLPFIAVGYDINESFTPELRLGTDQFMSDLSVEAVLTYKFFKKNLTIFMLAWGTGLMLLKGLWLQSD